MMFQQILQLTPAQIAAHVAALARRGRVRALAEDIKSRRREMEKVAVSITGKGDLLGSDIIEEHLDLLLNHPDFTDLLAQYQVVSREYDEAMQIEHNTPPEVPA